MTTQNTPHIDFGSLDKGEQIDAYLEKVVMPLLCDEIGSKLDKINSEIVLTIEHLPGSPLSVVLHRKDDETQSLIAKPLVNRNPKVPAIMD